MMNIRAALPSLPPTMKTKW